jgi:nucleoside-diphosphate-sugar epimerase
VNLALDSGVKKFCHISSVAALGRTTDGRVVDENVWWKTSPDNSWYAISKYGAEREVWRATEEGMDVLILNPSLILGPGDESRSSNEVFRVLREGTSWYTNGVTGYVDARDVAAAAVLLMNSEIRNERFLLSAANLSFRTFFDKVLMEFGRSATKFPAGRALTSLGWRGEKIYAALTGRKPRLTRETARASQLVTHFSGEKITSLTGFRYRSIDDTIREVCEFYKMPV